jgi:hypothetical protein
LRFAAGDHDRACAHLVDESTQIGRLSEQGLLGAELGCSVTLGAGRRWRIRNRHEQRDDTDE